MNKSEAEKLDRFRNILGKTDSDPVDDDTLDFGSFLSLLLDQNIYHKMMNVAAATGDFEDCTPGCTPGKCKVGSEHFLDLHYLLLTKCRENCKELGDCYICSEKIKNQEEKLNKQKEVGEHSCILT